LISVSVGTGREHGRTSSSSWWWRPCLAYGCSPGAGASLWASAGASQDHCAPLAP